MKKEKFGINCSTWDGIESKSVWGYRVSEFIAITQHHITNDWSVTHIPTGYSTCGMYPTKSKALRMANLIKNLDWDFKSPKSKKLKILKPMIMKLINP